MPWRCRNCGLIQSKDIGDCRSCGHTEAEQVSQEELDESIEGIDRPEPMRFDGGPTASTPKESDSAVWNSPDVNPDGSIANDGVETSDPVSRSWWESFSLEKWRVKFTGNVRFAVQVGGVALVMLTGYNLLLYPTVGIELWFGYREIFVQTLASQGGNEIGLYMISDIVVMVIGMIAAWFA